MTEKRFRTNVHRIYDNNEEIACADTMDDAEILVDLLNEQEELICELLYNFGELGYNNQPCKDCVSYSENIGYCTMYDMDVKAEDIVVRCEEREQKD